MYKSQRSKIEKVANYVGLALTESYEEKQNKNDSKPIESHGSLAHDLEKVFSKKPE